MSKVAISGGATGSATYTIQAPTGSTDRTLTLPDEAGTVLTSASTLSSSNLSGALPAIDGSALTGVGGKIVNIETATRTSSTFETSSNGYTDVPELSISYTMQDSSNKLFVSVAGSMSRGTQNGGMRNTINFDGTDIVVSQVRLANINDNDFMPFGQAIIDGYSGAKTVKCRVASLPNTSKVQVRTGVTLIIMEYTP